jgi:Kef-type K+ transport system membrane component KefB
VAEYNILFQLGILVGFSGLLTYFFKKIRIPSVTGYIIGGIILGPLTRIIDPNSDLVTMMAKLGILLITFEIGVSMKIDFLRRDALKVGSILIIELIVVIILSYIAGLIINFSWSDIVILALIAVNTSTSMAFKLMEETGISRTYSNEVKTLFGIATMEDVVAIISLTTLPALLSHRIMFVDIFQIILRIIIVIIAMIGLGLLIVKRFVDKLYMRGEELVLLIGLAIIMLFSWLGEQFGLTDVLGAFIGGLIFAETKIGEEFIVKGKWMRDLFIFMFFSSIGLRFPININAELVVIGVIISMMIVFIKFIAFSFAFWSSGTTLENAIKFGFYMISISEFAVIIADRGVILGVVSKEMLVVSVIVIIFSSILSSILVTYENIITPKFVMMIPKVIRQNLEEIFNVIKHTLASDNVRFNIMRKALSDLIIDISLLFIVSTITVSMLSYIISINISGFSLNIAIYIIVAVFIAFIIEIANDLRKCIKTIIVGVLNELNANVIKLSNVLTNITYIIIILIVILFILVQAYFTVLKVFEYVLPMSDIIFRAYAILTIMLIVAVLYKYVKKFIDTFQHAIKGA